MNAWLGAPGSTLQRNSLKSPLATLGDTAHPIRHTHTRARCLFVILHTHARESLVCHIEAQLLSPATVEDREGGKGETSPRLEGRVSTYSRTYPSASKHNCQGKGASASVPSAEAAGATAAVGSLAMASLRNPSPVEWPGGIVEQNNNERNT